MLEITAVVAIVVGLVEAIKRAVNLDSKFAPLVSLIFGIVIMSAVGTDTIVMNIFEGVIIGLTASGLYSGTKATLKQ